MNLEEALAEITRLRTALTVVYELCGEKLWKTRRRADSAGHHCDYSAGLQSVKDYAKKTLKTKP